MLPTLRHSTQAIGTEKNSCLNNKIVSEHGDTKLIREEKVTWMMLEKLTNTMKKNKNIIYEEK